MFGREVVEGRQHVSIPGPSGDSLVVFYGVSCDKEINGRFSVDAGLGLPYVVPYVVQVAFGLVRHGFGHRVQHIAGFMEPAALFPGCADNLAQRIPEPQSSIADRR